MRGEEEEVGEERDERSMEGLRTEIHEGLHVQRGRSVRACGACHDAHVRSSSSLSRLCCCCCGGCRGCSFPSGFLLLLTIIITVPPPHPPPPLPTHPLAPSVPPRLLAPPPLAHSSYSCTTSLFLLHPPSSSPPLHPSFSPMFLILLHLLLLLRTLLLRHPHGSLVPSVLPQYLHLRLAKQAEVCLMSAQEMRSRRRQRARCRRLPQGASQRSSTLAFLSTPEQRRTKHAGRGDTHPVLHRSARGVGAPAVHQSNLLLGPLPKL